MPIKILMPALSPTMEHGNLAKWCKKVGDVVKAGEIIAEIETDKATMEVEAVDEGKIVKILVPENSQEVPVNSVIAVLQEDDEELSDAQLAEYINSLATPAIDNGGDLQQDTSQAAEENRNEPLISDPKAPTTNSDSQSTQRIFASPLARNIAKQRNIDLSTLNGSGPRGRIVKADLENVKQTQKSLGITRNQQEYRLLPNSNMRKTIAKRLLDSKISVPHFYLNIECSMDNLLAARQQINDAKQASDPQMRVSVNDFIILAVAKALHEVPEANASWDQQAIKLYNNVDVSVAVAIEGGLITPIIRNADQRSLTEISTMMKDLVQRAKSNSLKPAEYQGGGFSISNLGMYGIKSFNAIINPPQACILAVGASNRKPVVVNDQIEIQMIMEVNLSCDHRVVDGAVGATFLKAFKKYIEAPVLMLI